MCLTNEISTVVYHDQKSSDWKYQHKKNFKKNSKLKVYGMLEYNTKKSQLLH